MSFLPDSPGRRVVLLLLGAGVLAVLVAAGFSLSSKLERRSRMEEIEGMRVALSELRMTVDSCRTDLARQETAFRRFDSRVDSLRGLVRGFEELDTAGVPEARYEEYLRVFERYNEAVPDWEALADTLRAHEAACREIVERHNVLADTLRARAEAWESEFGS